MVAIELSTNNIFKTITSLFQHLDEMIFIIRVEGSNIFRCIDVNQSYLDITGIKKEQIINKTIEEVLLGPALEFAFHKYNEALLSMKTLIYEETATLNDETKTYETTLMPIFADRAQKFIIGISRDISLRKRNEEEMIRSRQEFQQVIHHQQGLIFCVKKEKDEFYYSLFDGQLADNLNLSASQPVGKRPQDILKRDISTKINKKYETCWTEQRKLIFEEVDPYGRVWLTVLNPVLEDGITTTLIGYSMELTESRVAEKQLLDNKKLSLIGEMSAGIGHEIKNPLTSIKGFLKIMKEDKENITEDFIEIIESELASIERVTNELMMLQRPQAHQKIVFNMKELISEVVSLLQLDPLNRPIKINMMTSSDTIYIKGVKEQIKQLLFNIIKNAFESMEHNPNGTIEIETRQLEQEVMIKVIDQGCGIAEERLQTLGEPFYTTKYKGNGLGLMIARRIIRNHKGNLEIDSKLNKGTTLTIVLPCF